MIFFYVFKVNWNNLKKFNVLDNVNVIDSMV